MQSKCYFCGFWTDSLKKFKDGPLRYRFNWFCKPCRDSFLQDKGDNMKQIFIDWGKEDIELKQNYWGCLREIVRRLWTIPAAKTVLDEFNVYIIQSSEGIARVNIDFPENDQNKA